MNIDKELQDAVDASKWDLVARAGNIIVLKAGNYQQFDACLVCFLNSGGKSTGIIVDKAFCSNCGLSVGKLDTETIGEEARKRKHD